jgi:hypothetical protein
VADARATNGDDTVTTHSNLNLSQVARAAVAFWADSKC